MAAIFAARALLPDGWRDNVRVEIGADGRIARVAADSEAAEAVRVGVLLPAPGDLHSHAFQRAMAGMTEARGPSGTDDFWSWRDLMYRFVAALVPDDVEAIAALVQVEMLEAGYAAVGEFHYLHHAENGAPYDDLGEMSARLAAAAAETGIGLILLPVFYARGGLDGRPLEGGQRRFGCDVDRYAALLERAETAVAGVAPDAAVGVAPHSLRAVAADDLSRVAALRPERPIHIHVAEQVAEVEAVEAALGARPVAWLLENQDVSKRWCAVHATHMTPEEVAGLAASGAVAGLCPITEANLGDGVIPADALLAAGGAFGVGSDSNVRVSLAEELRLLEYSQRLTRRARAVLAAPGRSVGRTLYDGAAAGGARALGRDAGAIREGAWADLTALDENALPLQGVAGDAVLDAWIFAGDDSLVRDVWSAGRHVVKEGRHVAREAVETRYRATLSALRARL